MKRYLVSAWFASLGLATWAQPAKHVLFLGNSYTFFNTMPNMLVDLAASAGDSVIVDSNTPGGYTLEGHSTNTTSLSKIDSRAWDAVVLQEQSQRPSFPPNQVANEVFPYAEDLRNRILANDSCSRTLFFMTWGRQNGDQVNCASYPPLCTYEGMQARLRESYIQMASDNTCEVAPVGAAWSYIRANNPALGNALYSPDGSHPSANGSYLAACVFYAMLFEKSPVGLTYDAGLNGADASYMQQVAAQVVLDSLSQWQFTPPAPQAGFQVTLSGDSVQTTNLSSDASQVIWQWGDGSVDTASTPIHVYADSGTYTIRQIALSACASDTSDTTITIISDSPSNVTLRTPSASRLRVFPSPASHTLTLQWEEPRTPAIATTRILDVYGRLIWEETVRSQQHVQVSSWPSGWYTVLLIENGVIRETIPFLITH